MTGTLDTVPSEPGFINWIYTIMGVPSNVLETTSPYINMAYDISLETVNLYLDLASPILYTQACYNLGGDILCNMVQDDSTLSPPENTYWQDLRSSFNLNTFIPGIINAANDEDTSAASFVPLNMQNLTISDLQNLKTPWGRMYLSIAQSVGTMWGLTV
jgi:hypothetical protein